MRIPFLLSMCLFFSIACCKTFAQDTINWRADYKLKWENFQGKPDRSTDIIKAVSVPGITYKLSYGKKDFSYQVFCYFDKKSSWSNSNNDNLLVHEQGHFDIAEIFARKLRKKFNSLQFTPETIQISAKKTFSDINFERQKMDKLYDKETNLSRNKQKQLLWNTKISHLLKTLDAFAQEN